MSWVTSAFSSSNLSNKECKVRLWRTLSLIEEVHIAIQAPVVDRPFIQINYEFFNLDSAVTFIQLCFLWTALVWVTSKHWTTNLKSEVLSLQRKLSESCSHGSVIPLSLDLMGSHNEWTESFQLLKHEEKGIILLRGGMRNGSCALFYTTKLSVKTESIGRITSFSNSYCRVSKFRQAEESSL